jgi:hypothetical protein
MFPKSGDAYLVEAAAAKVEGREPAHGEAPLGVPTAEDREEYTTALADFNKQMVARRTAKWEKLQVRILNTY